MIAFTRAAYCNAEDSAAVVDFSRDGEAEIAILIAPGHRDEIWQALQISGFPVEPFTPPPVPVPASISDRQFAQQLAVLGTISEAEALAWAARGDLPAALEVAISALPEGARFNARMLLAAATAYERSHPLVSELGAVMGYDAEDLDQLWRAAALL
ncbi:hypothetical protein LJR090_002566 [Bosea sp. LjRoot90]|uniref:hypothetical protein n=1 Tax=Bosea sp. LjRoot90 TaxID=3342342 RepID=UPI003ECC1B3C